MRVAFLQALGVGKREQRWEKAVQEQLCSGHCLGEHGHQLGPRGCKDFGGGIRPRGESDQGESDEGASPGPSEGTSRSTPPALGLSPVLKQVLLEKLSCTMKFLKPV